MYGYRNGELMHDSYPKHLCKGTLSGRMGKMVASHAAVARLIPAEVALMYTMHEALRGYCL